MKTQVLMLNIQLSHHKNKLKYFELKIYFKFRQYFTILFFSLYVIK